MKGNDAPSYVPAYDGLRAVLLLAVLEYHYLHASGPQHIWFLSYALCCFFVLSGYLIPQLLDRLSGPLGRRLRVFYLRRSLRIFPAYFVVVLAAWSLLDLPFLMWHLSYLFNWKLFALSFPYPSWELTEYLRHWDRNGIHLWSMAVEEQFYLLFAPLWLWAPRPSRLPLLLAGIALSALLRIYLSTHYPESFYGALLPVCGEYLLWGALAWALESQGFRPPAATLWLGLGGLFLLGWCESHLDLDRYTLGQWRPPLWMSLYAAAFAAVVVGLKHAPGSWPSRLLSWRPLCRVGKVSYSAYLVHLFLNPWLDRTGYRPWLGPLVSVALATTMWLTFEGPINRLKDRTA